MRRVGLRDWSGDCSLAHQGNEFIEIQPGFRSDCIVLYSHMYFIRVHYNDIMKRIAGAKLRRQA